MTELLDALRPGWVGTSIDAGAPDESHEALALTKVRGEVDLMMIEATVNGSRHVTVVPAEELERLVSDAEGGFAGGLEIGGEVIDHSPEDDELAVPFGPLLVSGPVADWRRVLEREEAEVVDGGSAVLTSSEAWVGDRHPFQILDSE